MFSGSKVEIEEMRVIPIHREHVLRAQFKQHQTDRISIVSEKEKGQ